MGIQQSLIIDRLGVPARVGVRAYERQHPQPVYISLKVKLDFTKAISNDELEHTFDYERIAQELMSLLADRDFKLLEGLAKAIRDHLCEHHPVKEFFIRVEKPEALPRAETVAVEWNEVIE